MHGQRLRPSSALVPGLPGLNTKGLVWAGGTAGHEGAGLGGWGTGDKEARAWPELDGGPMMGDRAKWGWPDPLCSPCCSLMSYESWGRWSVLSGQQPGVRVRGLYQTLKGLLRYLHTLSLSLRHSVLSDFFRTGQAGWRAEPVFLLVS